MGLGKLEMYICKYTHRPIQRYRYTCTETHTHRPVWRLTMALPRTGFARSTLQKEGW